MTVYRVRHRIRSLLSSRSEHRLLALMLVLLHMALWWDFSGAISRSLMLAHLGAFLIWQPLWGRERELQGSGLALFSVLTLGFIIWLNWWLIAFWLVLLLGLVGGRVGRSRAQRAAYMIGGFFIVFELLITVVPAMFAVSSISEEIAKPLGYGLFILPLLLAAISGEDPGAEDTGEVDFLYGLTVALLVVVLVLGALISMYHFGARYPVAVLNTVIGIAVFLLATSWLWTPFAGFSGFGQLWARYLLNTGTPFERWLRDLSRLAAQRQSPDQFLEDAVAQLVQLPWVAGCEWEIGHNRALSGAATEHAWPIETRELRLTIYTPRPITTTLQLHGQLLVRLIADFHQAKLREQELAQRAHLEAIHQTGARVTHDIKNLLQSLYAMTQAVENGRERRPEELHKLLARQLPHLSQRLELALDKLQAPQRSGVSHQPVRDWWEAVTRRNEDTGIDFSSHVEGDPSIPSELYDSVIENLLENARFKRQSEGEMKIEVHLDASPTAVSVTVHDTGSPLPRPIETQLFRGPVRSAGGLGIGLFQSYVQASELQHKLALTANDGSGVTFELASLPGAFDAGSDGESSPPENGAMQITGEVPRIVAPPSESS